MYTPDDVFRAAQDIRPFLPELLREDAEAVDRHLAALLISAEAGEAVDKKILELMGERDPTREWMNQYMINRFPPPVIGGIVGMGSYYTPPPGDIGRIRANVFACNFPGCKTVWYRPKEGMVPPLCPMHKTPLMQQNSQPT